MVGVLLFLLKYVDDIIKDEKAIEHIMELLLLNLPHSLMKKS